MDNNSDDFERKIYRATIVGALVAIVVILVIYFFPDLFGVEKTW